jgi:hypothetical protein
MLSGSFSAISQNFYMLRGYVYAENNEPLVGASIRIVNLNTGTTTDNQGKYEIKVLEGLNRVSVSNTAFQTEVFELVFDKDLVKNVFLKIDQKQLDEVVVKTRKKDFSYEVIKNVIENKAIFLKQYQNYQCQTYIKSVENIEKKFIKKKEEDNPEKPEVSKLDLPAKKQDTLPKINIFECQLTRNENSFGQQKEEKTAVKKIGDQSTLFFKTITDGEFNLYKNHQNIAKIGENEIVSPLSDFTFLSYKFQLIQYFYEGKDKIYRIKVSPRELGNALYEGEIEVIDGIWIVRKLNLKLTKRALLRYDDFGFEQIYEKIQDRWMPTKTTYNWKVKEGDTKKSGTTLVIQSDFIFDLALAKRFFGAEVGLTTDSAYKRDSTFWDAIRPQPLAKEELAAIKAKDKLDLLMNSKVYLDSIDKVYNRINFQKIAYQGIGHINRSKKTEWSFNPVLGLFDIVAIGGFRMRYGVGYYKRYENRKEFRFSTNATYGFQNKDLKGFTRLNYFYNPIRISNLNLTFGSGFNVINGAATLADIARRSNFYQSAFIDLTHRTELLNGLYLTSDIYFEKRRDLSNLKPNPLGEKYLKNNVLQPFPNSQILKTVFDLSYTPGQLYLREPNQKIILGSKYPTFSLNFETGLPQKNRKSSVFNYISASIKQEFNIGVFGTSKYRINAGKFLDTTRLAIMDYKYQRGGDRYFFSPSMYTYQLIPKTFATFDWFFSSHYEHQFNGSLTSKIPFFNKTKIREVAGAGFLYVPERKFQYSELYGGLNRVFKVGRERLRLGVYYVVGQSNDFGLQSRIKFSIEPYNQNRNTWSF